MRRLQLAIVGFGKLGRACAAAITAHSDLALVGVVRRPESEGALPAPWSGVRVATHVGELGKVDAALVCVPAGQTLGTARDLMQRGVPVVECAAFRGEDFAAHKGELDRIAQLRRVPAAVGAGWDPGALSLLHGWFTLLTPHGHTEVSYSPGLGLHHSTVAQAVQGVRAALATELSSPGGVRQRYVYVELEPGAERAQVEETLRADPLFQDMETLVFVVDSAARLEDAGHGVTLQRRGTAAGREHELLLLEGRFDPTALAAQVMVAAARALPGRAYRAHSLFDLPLGSLLGTRVENAMT
jgi:diaminopimelate dehydrogenase